MSVVVIDHLGHGWVRVAREPCQLGLFGRGDPGLTSTYWVLPTATLMGVAFA